MTPQSKASPTLRYLRGATLHFEFCDRPTAHGDGRRFEPGEAPKCHANAMEQVPSTTRVSRPRTRSSDKGSTATAIQAQSDCTAKLGGSVLIVERLSKRFRDRIASDVVLIRGQPSNAFSFVTPH